MPGCSTGRNIQKYKGAAASTLQDVTDNGNTTTGDIITTSGFFIGDGSLLTGIAGASSAFSFQDTSDRGNTTSNTIQFTNTVTSLITSGNIVVDGNVTATDFYGDGTTLTGITLSTDMTSNVIRISNLESNLTANSSRIGSLETDLTSNASRIGSLETDLTSNASRIGSAETNISSLETDVTSNASRIGSLETDLTSNASRMGTAETNISSLETDVTSNATRIGSLETDLTSNASRITTVENNVLISNSSGITTGIGQGELLIGHLANQLSTLSLGADSEVLTCNTTSGRPEWKSASAIGTTVATLSNTAYIIGGSYNGGSAKTWSLKASTANSTDHIVIRDNSGDIYAREYHGDYIKHAGDTDTHLGFPSDDTLTITTAGTERMKFDSSGRTLIPNYFTHSGDTNTYFGFPTSDTFKIRTAGTDRFRIDSGGDVGIGVSNPVYKLDVAGNMNLTSGLYLDGGAGVNGQVLTSSAGGLMTWTTPSTNAATATKLASAVNIGGVPFDGSTSINLPGVDTSGSQDTTGEAGSIANVPDTASSSERSVAFLNGNQVKTNTNLTFKPTSNELKLTNLKITGALTAGSGTGINGQVLKSTGTGVVWGTDNTGGSGSGSSVWLQSGSTPNFIVTTPTPQSNVGISNIYPVEHTLHIGSNVIVSDTGGHDVLRVNGNVFCTNYLFGDGSKIRNLNTIRTETGANKISVGSDDGGPVLSWRERQIRYQQGSGRPDPPNYGF
jgi:hypothetical protein